MCGEIRYIIRKKKNKSLPEELSCFSPEKTRTVYTFHSGIPGYKPTPFVRLKNQAKKLGLSQIYVKDESFRFGLNAFKGLGGSYCMAKYLAGVLGIEEKELSFELLRTSQVKQKIKNITFVTATDGNHGRGVAWMAQELGVKCVVYLPVGSSEERLNNIRALGADASITSVNYDDTVRMAQTHAEQFGWVLLQDTSWEGYEEIPARIMQGYTTMGQEILQQLSNEHPTHIFLQAGVGAMAGAMAGFFASFYKGDQCPSIVIVEAQKADCLYQTAKADDGELHFVEGDLDTIMAGLACGEPCGIAWKILSQTAECFLSISDSLAEKGMQLLGRPIADDEKIISGESGAASMGAVAEIMLNPAYRRLKEELKLDETARVLLISTEGATDQQNYEKILKKSTQKEDFVV